MNPIRVLGLGSPLGDDQIGWRVVEQLQQSTKLRPLLNHQLTLAAYDRPGTGLIQLMAGAQQVFLIDGVQSGAAIGLRTCLLFILLNKYPAMAWVWLTVWH
jgi:hydrogenase maturation protease